MFRYQGHSLPGFGVGVVAAVLFVLVAPALATDVHLWHGGLVGLGVWLVIDVLSIVSLRRRPP